jgi:hypothetical protein
MGGMPFVVEAHGPLLRRLKDLPPVAEKSIRDAVGLSAESVDRMLLL